MRTWLGGGAAKCRSFSHSRRTLSTWGKIKAARRSLDQEKNQNSPKPGPFKQGKDQSATASLKSKSTPASASHDYSITPTTYTYTTENNHEQFERFPLVTSKKLSRLSDRPRQVRMLAREFMEDSLYNPNYGYFSKEVEIFTPSQPFEYGSISNVDEFMYEWTKEFKDFQGPTKRAESTQKVEQKVETKTTKKSQLSSAATKSQAAARPSKISRQVWHTPTELFQPHYGEALARYLVVNYELSLYPYKDLVIYEMGGGNGTLMVNILDYLREHHPQVYSRTRYNIIEISAALAGKQESRLVNNNNNGTVDSPVLRSKLRQKGHSDKVSVINKSIFEWDTKVNEPCFFIALEVFDNFAHDVVRYDNNTLEPYQGYVVIDKGGDFTEVFSPKLDPLAAEFMSIRKQHMSEYAPAFELGYHPLAQPSMLRRLKNLVYPLRENLSDPEYIPTRYLQFLHVLRDYFPEHRLLTSDFTHLPDSIAGYNAPVVQTVLDKKMVPISTYMALQGFFDILFPTDFDLAALLYKAVCKKLINTASHHDFLKNWAELDKTTTKTGENPMLAFYQNAAFMYS